MTTSDTQFKALPVEERHVPEERRGLLAYWFSLSVRTQILLTFVVVAVAAEIVAGVVVVLNARVATRVEISSALDMAERFVREAVAANGEDMSGPDGLPSLTLQLGDFRHVRIVVEDVANRPVPGSDTRDTPRPYGEAPAWFVTLVGAVGENRIVPVVADGEKMGSVVISGEPADEVAEVWEDVSALAMVTLMANLIMLVILYFATGRILAPLSDLAAGLRDLEHHRYRVQLVRPKVRELAEIATRFNSLAGALEGSREQNTELSRRLLSAQDDERRRTALELHDEVGPCIFGLRANVDSVLKLARSIGTPEGERIATRSEEIGSLLDRLQAVNREMLERLSPMALGHLPIADILKDLVEDFARHHAPVEFAISLNGLTSDYDDGTELTLYRFVQETLTNAVRHSRANSVTVEVTHHDDRQEPVIIASVSDDGIGFGEETKRGRGLLGIEERVHMLGGACRIDRLARGSRVGIELPVPRKMAGE